jgi:MFS family permease
LAGLLGAWLYRAMRVRREFRLLAEEAASGVRSEPFSLRMLTRILKEDPAYREYMLWMGVYGGGNLMLTAQLVLLFSERLHLTSGTQIGLLAVVPLITQPLFLPFWARLFDGSHVIRFRSRQGWALVLASAAMCAGVFSAWLPLLWAGAVLLGAANAGANLGWNLGHTDFASVGRAQHYMGVHVTLTGLRGGVAPPVGVLLYTGLKVLHPAAGEFALLLPLAMTLAGALGFNRMRRRADAQPGPQVARPAD